MLGVGAGSCSSSTEPHGPGVIAVSAIVESPDNFFEYGVRIDNGNAIRAFVGQDLSFTQNGLSNGNHTVSVVDVPEDCTGARARTVSLKGDTAAVVFSLSCPRTTGDLVITIETTGVELDELYSLTVNGLPGPELGVNGSTTFNGVPPNSYVLGLTDVEPNCSVPAEQTATVTAGQLTTITFSITCNPVGVLRFVTSTSGQERDPDGILVTIDDVTTRIGGTGTTNVRVATGTRSYTLSDHQPNCSLSVPASATLTLAPGDTVTIAADLSCASIPTAAAGIVTLAETPGDTMPRPPGTPASYDVLGMSARYVGGFLILGIKFQKPLISPATLDPAALYGYLEFDSDVNSSTGKEAFVNAWGGSSTQGVDYFTYFWFTDTASMQLIQSPTRDGPFYDAGRVRARFNGDSLVLILPLSKLSNTDGRMSITMLLGTDDRPTDIAPNTGQAGVQPSAPVLAARRAGSAGMRVVLDRKPIVVPVESGAWKRKH